MTARASLSAAPISTTGNRTWSSSSTVGTIEIASSATTGGKTPSSRPATGSCASPRPMCTAGRTMWSGWSAPPSTDIARFGHYEPISAQSCAVSADVIRFARIGIWAVPVYAATLFAGTITHQPPPQTELAGWSAYVTTNEFLVSHIAFSIFGAVFGAIGAVALGIVLMERGSVKLGLAGLLTGVSANVVGASIFGIAAFAQPAIGRLYLAGNHDLAQNLYYDAAQGTPMVIVAIVFILLLVASFIVFGVGFARLALMPRWAGIGYAVSGPLFAVIGFALDNWIQSVAAVLMTASAAWMVIAMRRQPA